MRFGILSNLTKTNYISTENMLPNRGGIVEAATLPSVDTTQTYTNGDILVSNIRPYFKKIWFATTSGGCSNDVLVFRAKKDVNPFYLYYILSDDRFFNYATATSKGTKMPRGDKIAIMNYEIEKHTRSEQDAIASILRPIDEKIALNREINNNLLEQATTLFKSWFVDFLPFNCSKPHTWRTIQLGDVSIMGAGGDKPKTTSATRTAECPYPIFSNGLTDYGLYGYTNEAKIFDESVTVSARGTIGFVCLRHEPYVPIVRLVTLIPKKDLVSAKYLYLFLLQTNILGTGTTQQQLTVPDFKKTEIVVPDNTTMAAFTDIVAPLFNQLWANEEENNRLSQLRDALLPKLLSGELDVSEVEI